MGNSLYSIKIITFIALCFFYIMNSYALELGVTTHIRDYDPNKKPDFYLKLLKEYGLSSYREDFPWARVEKERGVYKLDESLDRLDEFINKSYERKITTILILNYGNKLYTDKSYPVTESEQNAFANYAFWVANRYKGKVKYYEIWNEWLVKTGVPKNGEVPTSDVFLKLVEKTSRKIREADPSAVIITGSMNPLVAKDRSWIKELVSKGMLEYVDGISIHPYSYMLSDKMLNTPDKNLAKIDSLEGELKEMVGKEVPIYITEFGYPNNRGKNGLSETQSSNMMIQYTMLASNRNYIKAIWWYDFINDGGDKNKKENNFGILGNDLKPKKSGVYFKKFAGFEYSNSIINKYTNKNINLYNIQGKNGMNLIECPSYYYSDNDCDFIEK